MFTKLSKEEVAKIRPDLLRRAGSEFANFLRSLKKGEGCKVNKSDWKGKTLNCTIKGMKFTKMSTKDGIYHIIERLK
jgi:hypothetical protein